MLAALRGACCSGALFLFSSGFTSGPALQRLGPDHGGTVPLTPEQALEQPCTPARGGRLQIDGDARGTLPRCASQVLPLQPGSDCTLHVAVANLDDSEPLQFQIGLSTDARNFTDEPTYELAGGNKRWSDLRVSLGAGPSPRQLRFRISGKAPQHGVFSRPVVSCASPRSARPPARNLLLISLDTLRADRLGAYGNSHSLTPNLDRIALQGTTFLQAFAQYPNTLSSHAALFTGQYPSELGMVASRRNALAPHQATLASALARRGYVTVAFTEDAFVGSAFGFDRGFDLYQDGDTSQTHMEGYAATTFRRATDWLAQRPEQPFFMFLHTYEVHTPYAPSAQAREQLRAHSPDYAGPVGDVLHGLMTTAFNIRQLAYTPEDLRQVEQLYDAEVWSLDRLVGALFEKLAALEILDSTLVVITSDHGEEFAEHGYMAHGETLHQQALHVPLIFRAPGLVPEGLLVDSLIGLLDVPATIGDLLGFKPLLPSTSGRSHAAWMRAEPPNPARPVWSELTETPTACPEPREHGFGTCPYDGVSLRDRDYAYVRSRALNKEWLYDRRTDSDEQHDLAKERPELTAKYRKLSQSRGQSAEPIAGKRATQVDAATQAKLRALGYTR